MNDFSKQILEKSEINSKLTTIFLKIELNNSEEFSALLSVKCLSAFEQSFFISSSKKMLKESELNLEIIITSWAIELNNLKKISALLSAKILSVFEQEFQSSFTAFCEQLWDSFSSFYSDLSISYEYLFSLDLQAVRAESVSTQSCFLKIVRAEPVLNLNQIYVYDIFTSYDEIHQELLWYRLFVTLCF